MVMAADGHSQPACQLPEKWTFVSMRGRLPAIEQNMWPLPRAQEAPVCPTELILEAPRWVHLIPKCCCTLCVQSFPGRAQLSFIGAPSETFASVTISYFTDTITLSNFQGKSQKQVKSAHPGNINTPLFVMPVPTVYSRHRVIYVSVSHIFKVSLLMPKDLC